MTNKAMRDEYRAQFVSKLKDMLGDDADYVASNELNLPIVLPNGDEAWITVKCSIPSGDRATGEYDGYEARKNYVQECADKAIKAAAREARAKAKEIESK